jgi:hypothetical protein
MPLRDLPESVVRAWGPEVARDFAAWVEEQLQAASGPEKVQISALVARQKVNVLMLERVSNLLLAGEPRLRRVADDECRWLVPVDLTLPARGRIGCVGEIEVDARYGGLYYDNTTLSQIAHEAERLTRQVLHAAT